MQNVAFLTWVLVVFLMIVCATTLSALSSSKSAWGVIRFKQPTPVELTNCVAGDSFDLFPALTGEGNIGFGADQNYLNLNAGNGENKFGPYCFENLNMFENKTITKIVAPVYQIKATSNVFMTVFVISNKKGAFEVHQTHKLYVSQEFIDSFNPIIGAWVTFKDLNIKVLDGETLAFVSYNDSLGVCYSKQKIGGRGFYGCGKDYVQKGQWWDITMFSLMFDVFAYSDRLTTGLSSNILGESATTKLDNVTSSVNGYVYKNTDLFKDKLITKIVAPVYSINESAGVKFWTVKVIKATRGKFDVVRTYRLEMSEEQIIDWNADDKNKWVMFSNLNILVGNDETLAFTDSADTVSIGYANGIADENSSHAYYVCKTNTESQTTWEVVTSSSLLLDIYGRSGNDYLLMQNSIAMKYETFADTATLNPNYIWRFNEDITNRISGRVITKLTVPIYQIDASVTNASGAYINLFVINKKIDRSKGEEYENGVQQAEFQSDYLRSTHKLSLTEAQFKNFQRQSWITFDNLNIDVGKDETIAFGCWNSGTMGILFFSGTEDTERIMISPTWLGWSGGILPIDVYVQRGDRYSNLLQSNSAKEIVSSKLSLDSQEFAVLNNLSSSGLFAYSNSKVFENKTITKFVVPVYNIINDLNAFLTVSVVNTTNGEVARSYNLILTASEIAKWKALQTADTSSDKCAVWLTFDELNIDVGVQQTIAFCASDDTITLLYSTKNTNTDRAFTSWASGQKYQNYSLVIDIYGYTQYDVTPLDSLTGVNEQQLFNLDVSADSKWKELTVNNEFIWMYGTSMFEKTIINRIVLPVKKINSTSSAEFTLHIVGAEAETDGSHTIISSQKLTMNATQITAFTQNYSTTGGWVTFDNLDIRVKSGQTLAFGSATDTIVLVYYFDVISSNLGIKTINGKTNFTNIINLPIGFYGTKSVKSVLKGKSLSILGDSISTYSGYNNITKYNSTIGGNAVAYPGILKTLSVNDTWWMRTINQLGMNLCVNNSWSGSHTYLSGSGNTDASSAWNTRSVNLHNDNTGKQPDVIAVFMGTNDFCQLGSPVAHKVVTDDLFTKIENGTLTVPSSFDEAYALMIYKMTQKYSSADVFCMTIHYAGFVDNNANYKDYNGNVNPTAVINEFNDIIKAIATHYGCPVVDVYADSGINIETASTYTIDRVHPNADGMGLITNCLINKMTDYYLG